MRIIVVLGGIFSGIGKGIVAASIGRILKEYGYSVTAVKIDPYINFDAGTMRPTEHGEVWVTDDGGEIDQDLGNYERFLGISLPKGNNITTGQVYWHVIRNERKGRYLGKTVQFIPHIPNEIKRRIAEAGAGYDFVIVEIGGVVGDYENLPFLFAMRSFEVELGRNNVVYVLVSYMPVPEHLGEMKTKPTQQAIRMLNESGIFPDFVIARASMPIDSVRKQKIETYANIGSENVISAPDVDTVYEVPLQLENERMGEKILHRFGLQQIKKPDWTEWNQMVARIKSPSRKLRIAMIGKYITSGDFELTDSYISINQALEHAAATLDIGAEITWVDSTRLEKIGTDIAKELSGFHGVIVPGGFGSSGIEGKIAAIKYCRDNDIPYLGLCLGLQLAVVEYARNVCGLMGANSTEIDPQTPHPVIDVQKSQVALIKKSKYGASMRLGAYAASLMKNSLVWHSYKKTGRMERDMRLIEKLKNDPGNAFRIGDISGDCIIERHRHRYEVNPKYTEALSKEGIVFSGWHVRNGEKLMEFIELPKLRFFAGTQAHPEFKSSLTDPAPLFVEFLRAAGE
ncbi:MAG: CTP synthase [Candidatus Aenigmarchaeota archaeon]|nr:CTP synthase [Candidatus Aenigmarchaeota archaeon]